MHCGDRNQRKLSCIPHNARWQAQDKPTNRKHYLCTKSNTCVQGRNHFIVSPSCAMSQEHSHTNKNSDGHLKIQSLLAQSPFRQWLPKLVASTAVLLMLEANGSANKRALAQVEKQKETPHIALRQRTSGPCELHHVRCNYWRHVSVIRNNPFVY